MSWTVDGVKLTKASPSREQPVFMNGKTRGKAAVLVHMCNPKSFLDAETGGS